MKKWLALVVCCVVSWSAQADLIDKMVSAIGKSDVVEYEITDTGKIEQIVETKVGQRQIYFICKSYEEREPVIYQLTKTQYYGSISKGYTAYLILGKGSHEPSYIVYKDKVLEVERVAKIAEIED